MIYTYKLIYLDKLKGKQNLRDLGVDGKIIIIWILNK
jgi:hypothetical protein